MRPRRAKDTPAAAAERREIGDDPQRVLYESRWVPDLQVRSRNREDVDFYLQKAGGVLIVEGPPETGKTTLVKAALARLDPRAVTWLGQREQPNQALANLAITKPRKATHVVLDDVHELSPDAIRDLVRSLERHMSNRSVRLHVTLIGLPMPTWKEPVMKVSNPGVVVMKPETNDSVRALIDRYQEATNLRFEHADAIVAEARGSFRLAQAICVSLIAAAGIEDIKESQQTVYHHPTDVRPAVLRALARACRVTAVALATLDSGTSTRGLLLNVLWELASSGKSAVDLRALRQRHAHLAEGFDWLDANLSRLINERKDMAGTFSYAARTLECHDAQMIYFLSVLPRRAPAGEPGDSLDWESLASAARTTLFVDGGGLPKYRASDGAAASLDSASGKSILDCVPPYPWWHEKAKRLHREVLTPAYPDPELARTLLKEADVMTGRISFNEAAEKVWSYVLEAASSQGKLRALLQLVRKDEYVAGYWPRIDECVAPVTLL